VADWGVGLVSESGVSWWTGLWVVGAVSLLRNGGDVVVEMKADVGVLQGRESSCGVEVGAGLRGGRVQVGGGACCVAGLAGLSGAAVVDPFFRVVVIVVLAGYGFASRQAIRALMILGGDMYAT
jgi:hypothetical protein